MTYDDGTSLLDKWNQMHVCPNLIVANGACMTSASRQNPSLIYIAIAVRAVNHVVEKLKKYNNYN